MSNTVLDRPDDSVLRHAVAGPTMHAGPFAALGLSGLVLTRQGAALGVRLGIPHPSLGLCDGIEVLYSLSEPPSWGVGGRSGSVAWRVPVTEAGVQRFARQPLTGVNGPRVVEYSPGEAAVVRLDWCWDGASAWLRYRSDTQLTAALIAGGAFAPATITITGEGCRLEQDGLALTVRCGVAPRCLADDPRQAEIRWFGDPSGPGSREALFALELAPGQDAWVTLGDPAPTCLLYTSDAADDM
jgi:hypothetical protein